MVAVVCKCVLNMNATIKGKAHKILIVVGASKTEGVTLVLKIVEVEGDTITKIKVEGSTIKDVVDIIKVGKIKAVAIIITKTNVEGMTTNMVNIVEVVDMEALEAVEDTKEDMATVVVTKAEEEEGEVIILLIIDVINTNDRCCTDRFIFSRKD